MLAHSVENPLEHSVHFGQDFEVGESQHLNSKQFEPRRPLSIFRNRTRFEMLTTIDFDG